MVRRLFKQTFDPYVSADVARLLESYGSSAIFMARHAAIVAGGGRRCHWKRVVAEVELLSGRRDW